MKNILKLGSRWCLAAIFSANSLAFGAVPVITGFNPTSGSNGTPVTITGANFGTAPSNNIVYFGAVRATVATANQSNLLVTVPSGATYAPVTVTVGGLVAYSGRPFQPGFAGSPGISTSTFAPGVTVPTSPGPIRIAIGDLNGDGKPDFVVASTYANTISIYQNLGTGGPLGSNSFASPIIIPFGSGDNPYWITLADVDGDGKLDIVAPDQNNNVVTVFRNVSSGGALSAASFASPVSFTAGSHPREVVVRDLDGDGRPDIAVANIGDDTISILKNIGAAGSITSNSFAAQIILPAGSQPHTLAVGDLDRDGKPDLAVGNYTSPFVSLFRNVSVAGTLNSNSFAARVDLPANFNCNSIVLGDVDGEGRLDIVCGTAEGNSAVSVFHNVSSPGVINTNSFEPRVDFASGGWVNSVALGDLDGDGRLDILSVTQIGNTFSVYPNQSVPGTFTSGSLGDRVDFPSGSNPNGISVCDLNGDGRPDVLFGNFYDGTLTFYQNAAASASNGPTITSQPTNQTVSAGGMASFSVTATGSPTLYYQWWRGPAIIIPGATSPTLTLSNVQPSDAGTYLVIVTNQFGFAMSSNAVLTVTGGATNTGPVITQQPTNQTVSVGGTAIFSVTATDGSVPLTYQWYSPYRNEPRISGATNSTLTLSNVQPGNAGPYFVIVTDPFGSVHSSNAVLTVTGGGGGTNTCTPPPSGLVGWWKGEGNANDSAGTNNGVLVNGVGFAAGEVGQGFLFTHTNQDVKIPTNSNLDVGLGSGLTLEAWINPSDVSKYNPIFEYNPGDGVTYWGVHLYVLPTGATNQPGFLYANVQGVGDVWHQMQTANGIVTPNSLQHVALTYDKASGIARLYRNGAQVAQSTFGSFTPKTTGNLNIGSRPTDPANDTFTFSGVIDEPSVYNRALSSNEIAAIYNASSSGKCTSTTISNTAPVITKQPTNQTVSAGGNAMFSVTATGSPTLHYQWFGPGTSLIAGAINPTLTLSNVQPGNAGSYFVRVTNSFGFAQSSNAVLTVTGGGGTNTCTPPPTGLVAWWPAEGNGNDIVGGNTAVPQVGVSYAPGEVGQAFLLNNSSNAYLAVAASSNMNVGAAGGFTIEAWIKPSDVMGFHPIAEWNDAAGHGGAHLWIVPVTGQSGVLYANVASTDGSSFTLFAPNGSLAPNVFQHVALTYDKTSGLGTLYVNGNIVVQQNLGSFTPQTTYPFWIGHRPADDPANPTYGAYLGGLLDELSLYRRALSSSEITAIYNAGSAGKCAPNTGVAPIVTKQPTNQTVSVGGNATFSVTATGSPTLHYQWFGPGTSLIVGAINPTLTLSNVQTGNAGSYFVRVTNSFGFAQSSNAVLTVTGGGPSTNGLVVPNYAATNQIIAADGTLNEIARVQTVYAASEFPPHPIVISEIRWRPDQDAGGPLSETISNLQIHLSTTTANPDALSATFAQNTGSNDTVVFNGAASISSAFTTQSNGTKVFDISIPLQTPFVYDSTKGNLLVDLRNFSGCTPARGNFVNGTVNGTDGVSRAQSFDPNATNASFVDSGGDVLEIIYTVNGGTSNTPPVITKQPTNQTVSAGGTATFSVTATGSPTMHYQWFGPGTSLIAGAINSTLTLSNVQPSNAGSYFVLVTNLFGSVMSSNAVLTVTGGGGGSNTCTPPPTGLVAWWKAEGNGLDSAGANNGTLLGDLGFTSGEVGQAFNFTDNTQGVQVNASPSLAVKNITIEAWIRPADVSDFHPIIEYGADTGLDPVQFLYGWNDPAGTTPGALFGIFRGTNDTALVINSPAGILPAGQWSHVAMTFNFTNQTGTLYLNGTNVGSSVFTNGIMVPQTSLPVHLGYRPNTSGEGRAGDRLSGELDEVSIYNRALSQSEIQAIYHAGSSGKCTGNATLAITAQPTNVTAFVGSTATLKVTAVGTGPLGYQWWKSNSIVAGATNSILTLTNVQFSNAGTYHVVVSDSLTSVTSSNATLTVLSPPVATVAVVNTSASAGLTFDLPINLIANGNENALSFTLNFDPARLAFSNINVGSGGGDAFLLPNTSQAASGIIGVQLALPAGETFNAGTQEIVRVTFNTPILTGTQSVATAVSFTGVPIAKLLSDVQGHALAANFVNGTVTLSPSRLEGDASPVSAGNGTVDVFDWVQVGRFVAGLDTITNSSEFQKVDCAPRNTLGDGQLKVTDWVQAGRYAAGLDPVTLAGGPTALVPQSLIANASSGVNSRQVAIQSGSTVKGMAVTLPITLEAQGDETALAFSLNFDPTALQYVSAVKGSAATSANLVVNATQAADGKLAMVLCLPSAGSHFAAGTVEIAKVTFVALSSTTNNTVAFADLPVPRSISDTNATELTANYLGNAVVINPQPTVGLSYSGNTSLLSWPVWAGDFTLQAAGSLTPPINWTNVPVTLQTNGNNIEITLPTPDQQTFFRLYHP